MNLKAFLAALIITLGCYYLVNVEKGLLPFAIAAAAISAFIARYKGF